MSRWLERLRPQRLQLHIGNDLISWRGDALPLPSPLPPDALHHVATYAWADALRPLIDAAPAGSVVEVTVADAWCRYWLVQPPAGLRDLAELRQVAQARFMATHGGDPLAWVMEADWRGDQAFVGCALPEALLTALRKHCEGKLQLGRIVPEATQSAPWLRAVLRQAPKATAPSNTGEPGPWACCLGPRSVVGLVHRNGEPVHVWQRWLDEPLTPALLIEQLRQTAWLLGEALPQRTLLLPAGGRLPSTFESLGSQAQRVAWGWWMRGGASGLQVQPA